MASPMTPLFSIHKPAALLELALKLQTEELALPAETRPDNISITYDTESGVVTLAATLPTTFSVDADGKLVVTATEYL